MGNNDQKDSTTQHLLFEEFYIKTQTKPLMPWALSPINPSTVVKHGRIRNALHLTKFRDDSSV